MDLMPEDRHRYRVAFIEAFRRRGIYPRNVRTLSEDSLRWPAEDPSLEPGQMETMLNTFIESIKLRQHVDRLRYKRDRKAIWEETRGIRNDLHGGIRNEVEKAVLLQRLTGLALADSEFWEGVRVRRDGMPVFAVQAFREARRLQDDGRVLNQVFITLLQKQTVEDPEALTLRCGSTLVLDLNEGRVTCVIRKPLGDRERIRRTLDYEASEARRAALSETYFGGSPEPFAALHRIGA
jgi:hypothetical protein